jgi:cobalamin synthase
MERVLHIHRLLLRSRRLPVLILALTLGILAGAILLTSLETRRRLREQIAGRNGDFFHALAQMHMSGATDGYPPDLASQELRDGREAF